MSSAVTEPEYLSELLTLSSNTTATFWVPTHPALPYHILLQNIQVLLKHAASQSPEDKKALLVLRCIYTEAKLSVEEANLDANIVNKKLLQDYRTKLRNWRKKWAAVR